MKKLFFLIVVTFIFVTNLISQTVLNGVELKSFNPYKIVFEQSASGNIWAVNYDLGQDKIISIDMIKVTGDSSHLITSSNVKEIYFQSEDSVPNMVFQKSTQVPAYGHWPKTQARHETLISTKISHSEFTEINLKYEVSLSHPKMWGIDISLIVLVAFLGLGLFLACFKLIQSDFEKNYKLPHSGRIFYLFLSIFLGGAAIVLFLTQEDISGWLIDVEAAIVSGATSLLFLGAVIISLVKEKKAKK